MRYHITIVPDDDQFQAIVHDMPNVVVSGDSVEDATQRAEAAIKVYVDYLKEKGLAIPEPKAVPAVVEAA